MTNRLLFALHGIFFCLPLLISASAAENPSAELLSPTTLNEIAGQLEVAAKRFNAPDAEGLRATAQIIKSTASGDARILLAAIRLPIGNEALMQAVKDVEIVALATQIKRDDLTSQAKVETRRRARELIAKARSSEEIEPFIASLKLLESDAAAHPPPGEINKEKEGYENLAGLFGALSDGMKAGVRRDSEGIANAVSLWGRLYSNVSGFLSYEETQDIRARILLNPELEIEQAKHALEAGMAEWKPASQLSDALDRFQKASDLLRGLSFYNPGFIPDLYRKAAGVEIGLETSYEAGMEHKVAEVRKSLRESLAWVISARCEGLRKFLNPLDNGIREAKAKSANEKRIKLLAKIRNIEGIADLKALCAEFDLADPESESHDENDGRGEAARLRQAIGSQLINLGLAARSGDFSAIDNSFAIGSGSEAHETIEEIRDLRSRLERQAVSQTLRAPELIVPPLSDLSVTSALEALYDSAAGSADWRRALGILELQESPNFPGLRSPRGKDAAASVRAFLAGQNFEAAEQWKDAVVFYNTVLRRAVARTPIHEAAERIKAIRRAHPQAFISIQRRTP